MSSPRFLAAAALFGMLLPGFSDAQTFVVRDRNATVTNANIKDDTVSAGDPLASGDSFSFQGDVNSALGAGVGIDTTTLLTGLTFTIESGVTISTSQSGLFNAAFLYGFAPGPTSVFDGTLTNRGTIQMTGVPGVGLAFQSDVNGTVLNEGTISSVLGPAVFIGQDLNGSFVNTGTIANTDGPAFLFGNNLNGSLINTGTIRNSGFGDGVSIFSVGSTGVFRNSGTISAGIDGFNVGDDFNGFFENSGTITGRFEDGVDIGGDLGGTFVNRGTISGFVDGVFVFDDITGSFLNTGTIVGQNQDGVAMFDLIGTFGNRGTITAAIDGVYLDNDLTGSFHNSGTITGGVGGVFIEDDLDGFFENTGTITGNSDAGVEIFEDLTGTFINRGTIVGNSEGVAIGQDFAPGAPPVFTGTFLNYGRIEGGDDGLDILDLSASGTLTNRGTIIAGDDGIDVDGDFLGRAENFGTIMASSDGVDIDGIFSGEMFNCGIIEGGQFGFLVSVGGTGTGTFHNHGGRVQGGQGGQGAISMGDGNGTVLLSGPSHIVGSINGGAGTGDVLRFQDMRGISAEKEAELVALAANDPNAGTVTLFGESITWLNVEDIQADGSTLESYEGLFAGTGLGGYGNALDNLNGLNDSLREFLKALNDVPLSELTQIASSASGQTLRNAMADLRRNRDTNFYHLFSNQFSSLRGDVAGEGSDLAVRSQGFFSQEVEIGASVQVEKSEVSTWVTSYVGSSSQDGNGVRAEADYDETTILFGRGTEWGEGGWLGWFGGYSRTDGRVDGFGSYLENDGGWFGLNAQLRRGDAFATLVGGIGYQDIKTNRIDFLGNAHEGNTEAFGAFFYSQVGRDFYFGEENNGKWTPYAGFTYGGDAISAYSENGAVASALRFQDDTETVFQTVLGVSVTGYNETRKGWFKPRADLAWWHSYGDDSFGAGLASTNLLNNFSVFNPGANENRGVFQVGIEFGFDCLEDWTFEAGYFGVLGESDFSSNGATLGARVEF